MANISNNSPKTVGNLPTCKEDDNLQNHEGDNCYVCFEGYTVSRVKGIIAG